MNTVFWASFSSSVSSESRCSARPASSGVSQVPQVPSPHEKSTGRPRSCATSRMLRSGGTTRVTPLAANATSKASSAPSDSIVRGVNRSTWRLPAGHAVIAVSSASSIGSGPQA